MEVSGIKPIIVTSAAHAAAHAIRDAIIEGKLKPGGRLVERELATSLGVGQPTLREALKELEYQGFVCKTGSKGTTVARYTREDVTQIMEIRLLIEALAIEKAAERITPEVESQLVDLVDDMELAAEAPNLSAFHKADVAFHRIIWDLSGNKYVRNALEAVAIRLFVFGAMSHSQADFIAAVPQHRQVLEGIATRDPIRARDCFLRHTVDFWNGRHDLSLEVPFLMGQPSGLGEAT